MVKGVGLLLLTAFMMAQYKYNTNTIQGMGFIPLRRSSGNIGIHFALLAYVESLYSSCFFPDAAYLWATCWCACSWLSDAGPRACPGEPPSRATAAGGAIGLWTRQPLSSVCSAQHRGWSPWRKEDRTQIKLVPRVGLLENWNDLTMTQLLFIINVLHKK
jgi:hypothetical protein